MKSVIIIKKMGGEEDKMTKGFMGTKLKICDCIFEDAENGEEVEFEGKGILIDKGNGERFIAVREIEGEAVEEMEESEGMKPPMMPEFMKDSEDALMDFVKNLKE